MEAAVVEVALLAALKLAALHRLTKVALFLGIALTSVGFLDAALAVEKKLQLALVLGDEFVVFREDFIDSVAVLLGETFASRGEDLFAVPARWENRALQQGVANYLEDAAVLVGAAVKSVTFGS